MSDLDQLERRMERRWLAVVHAQSRQAAEDAYGLYLAALDDYCEAKSRQDRERALAAFLAAQESQS